MNDSEKSIILYLIESIIVAPNKKRDLINVIYNDNRSIEFKKFISDIRKSNDYKLLKDKLR